MSWFNRKLIGGIYELVRDRHEICFPHSEAQASNELEKYLYTQTYVGIN